jgi:hypothetical protein
VTVSPARSFAEVLWRQASLNGHVAGLEAMYEVVDGDRSFTALIRGGSNAAGALGEVGCRCSKRAVSEGSMSDDS